MSRSARPAEKPAAALSRAAFLAGGTIERRRVAVPALGGHVFVQTLTVAQSDVAQGLIAAGANSAVTWVIAGACDEGGAPLFTAADAEALATMPAAPLNTIARAVLELNALGGGAVEEAKND